ncbi:penicillin-binding protein activator, partial [Legionella sp.]|uniref:penicillin-binding protein activator n=1 Tax=Legionella sp. TaxID=459 RepID=UPI0032203050
LKPYLHSAPKQIALLLPLSGPLAGPGGAIRDGFMAAASNSSTTIRQYDTAVGDVAALYQQALSEGADYVVGPLSKTDVAVVATMEHPVPTLLLNDIDVTNSTNAYRFGLSPSNEARQVAVKAEKKGYKRALIIAPAGQWGDEIVAAFTAQWQSSGGVIVDKLAYGNNDNLNVAVRDLLHVSDSQAREKRLKDILGQKIQMIPRRRQDFDMIFLLAYPSKARQIMPLLRYYFAGDVPVYATSTVYAGSPNIMRDKDLDGIIFSDMPWVFAHQMANKNWPEQLNSYSRLYALGMDSYTLSTQLNQLLLFPAMGIDDKSGVLYLNRAQQIARIPAWGQFKGGVAVTTS